MKPVVLVLGALGLVAVGGGAAVLLTNRPHTAASPAPTPAPAAQTAPAAQPVPAETAATPASAPLPTPISFVPLVQDFSLVRDSAAYVAADQNAPQLYPLKSGTPLVSAARSPDGTWTVAMTADGRAAFIPTADIGPYDPRLTPQPQLPQTVSGTPDVIDTGTLMIDGQTIPLAGVIGHKGEVADRMQMMIKEQGPQVNCTLQQGTSYICTLPGGADVGRFALFNGAAEVANDASQDYRDQAEAGRAAHRGIWK